MKVQSTLLENMMNVFVFKGGFCLNRNNSKVAFASWSKQNHSKVNFCCAYLLYL